MSGAGVQVLISGFHAVRRTIGKAKYRINGAVAAAMYQKGWQIMADSVPVCPKRTGRLRGTNYVAPPYVSGNGDITVEIGYGTEYAVYVHEAPLSWGWRAPGTGSKFLSAIVLKHEPTFARWIGLKARENTTRRIGMQSLPSMPLSVKDT